MSGFYPGLIPEPPINPPLSSLGTEEQNTIREILADALEKLAGLEECLDELKDQDLEAWAIYFTDVNRVEGRSRIEALKWLKYDLVAWLEEITDV